MTKQAYEDVISRARVLNEIKRWRGYLDKDMIERINIRMKMLPPAESQQPKGEWQLVDHLWECNRCHYRLTLQNKSEPTNFCPNCGSRNRKE